MKELTPIQRAGTALLMAIRDADANNKFFGPVDAADFLKRELAEAVPARVAQDEVGDEGWPNAEQFEAQVWNECRKAFLGEAE